MKKANENLIWARATAFTFGSCEETGLTLFPDSAIECIEKMKQKGFIFEDTPIEEAYSNGEWHFKNKPVMTGMPSAFVEELLFEYANPHKKIAYFKK